MIYRVYTTIARNDDLIPRLHTETNDGSVAAAAAERVMQTIGHALVMVLVENGEVTDIRRGQA